MSALGALLRQLREDSGLTQEELAERSGVSARTVSDIERGLRLRLYADTADRLAGALDLDEAGRREFWQEARGHHRSRFAAVGALPRPLTQLVDRVEEL